LKKILYLTLILLFLMTTLVQAADLTAAISISPETIDLGTISTGKIVEQFFVIKNEGDSDLVLTAITVDCPCSAFAYLKSDGDYQPYQPGNDIVISAGTSLSIKLNFNPEFTKYRGQFKKYILISSNDPQIPIYKIALTGEIVSETN